jgi:hypothetical protein
MERGLNLAAVHAKTFRLLPFAFYLNSGFQLKAPANSTPICRAGEAALQGEWQQDTAALQKKLVNYSLYHFKFSCDSFFVSVRSFSKANGGYPDSCVKNGQWSEYAKGVYEQKHDTLRLKGLFSNADLTYKVEGGCFRSGKYEETFKLNKKTRFCYSIFPNIKRYPF